MEREIYYDKLEAEALLETPNYVDISNLDLCMRIKLLLQMFEQAPIVDDSIPDYDILEIVAKNILMQGKIKNWFGKRIDTDLSKNKVLTNVFNKYTGENVLENLVILIQKES